MPILDQSFTTTPDATAILRFASNNQVQIAQQFTPTNGGICTQVILGLRRNGTVSGNVSVAIYSDTGSNLPNAQIGTGSANLDASTISVLSDPTTEEKTFTNISAIVTSGVKYWIVLSGDYSFSSTIYIAWGQVVAGGYSGGQRAIYDGTSWTANAADMYFKQYYDPIGGAALFL